MAGFVSTWDAELNAAQSLVTRFRDAADAIRHHKEWLATVAADGELIWKGTGATTEQIATLRGAFDALNTGITGTDFSYAQNLYRGQ